MTAQDGRMNELVERYGRQTVRDNLFAFLNDNLLRFPPPLFDQLLATINVDEFEDFIRERNDKVFVQRAEELIVGMHGTERQQRLADWVERYGAANVADALAEFYGLDLLPVLARHVDADGFDEFLRDNFE